MPLHPSETARTKERILLIGPYGGGKSHAWAKLREWYALTDTPGHFHILSTEYEMADRTAEGFTDFDTNATIYETTDYPSLLAASEAIERVAAPEDWLVVDSIGNPHQWSRDVWFHREMGMSYKEFLATGKKMAEVPSHGWGEMTGLYKDWLDPYVIRFKGHKLATAQAATVNTQGSWADSPAIQKMYGRVGVKPEGHKELGYVFHTVLFATQRGRDDWRLTTIDDPSRTHLADEPCVPDFVSSYLINVAGWSVD